MYKLFTEQETERVRLATAHLVEQVSLFTYSIQCFKAREQIFTIFLNFEIKVYIRDIIPGENVWRVIAVLAVIGENSRDRGDCAFWRMRYFSGIW